MTRLATATSSLRLFKALGEPTTHDILKVLLKGERCACELPALIGKTQSNTSMHLAKLQSWKIITSRKDGRKIIYSVSDNRVRAILNAVINNRKRNKSTEVTP